MNRVVHVAGIFALALFGLHGESLPSFEIASIRPFDRTGQVGHGSMAVSGPRITMTGYTLNAFILYA